MVNRVEERANHIFERLKQDKRLGRYVDETLPVPSPYRGSGAIKLIVLGQDPTVKNPEGRRAIITVLNLDRNRSVRAYLAGVCNGLGIQIAENVYATNLYKNFFIHPPTKITEIDVFQEFRDAWLPLLKDELEAFADIPVITLGEPLLAPLVGENVSAKVRVYWGYTPEWKAGRVKPFGYIRAADNQLNRTIFPFPHQPSLRKLFYKARMSDYVSFVKAVAFSEEVELELQQGQIVVRPTYRARHNWEDQFKAMVERGDDRLLDGDVPIPTAGDEQEWEW